MEFYLNPEVEKELDNLFNKQIRKIKKFYSKNSLNKVFKISENLSKIITTFDLTIKPESKEISVFAYLEKAGGMFPYETTIKL